ncbi:MAG: pantetheine-phosphate adenylyltransferase [Caldisericaceae bacterium]|nr:pantetheine-phosphate adenylyltransferase [Caldisericaceae bacterium]
MKKIIAYPGTFDPITNGHLDIIKRGADLFDELVIFVAESNEKYPLFTLNERIEMVQCLAKEFNNVSVMPLKGLLTTCLKENNIKVVLRGLRTMSDFEYEFQMALINKKLYPDLETVLIMSSSEFVFLSSSLVREIAFLDGDVSKFVPSCVEKRLKGRSVNNGR